MLSFFTNDTDTKLSRVIVADVRLSSFFRTLCESLEELPLLFVVSSHKLFMELLKEEERKVLVEQMRKRSATINLSAKPLPSFYDIPGAVPRSPLSAGRLASRCSVTCFRDVTGFCLFLHSFSECEHWAVGAAAHPPAGAAQDQTDPHRAPRHG